MPVLMLMMSLLAPHLMPQTDAAAWTQHRLIAHAMGGIDGMTATNSYDAFVANYEKGFRVFEVDLRLTSDDELVARHDWLPYLYAMLGQDQPDVGFDEPLSHSEFKSLMIGNRYRPLDFGDIVDLLERYPDAYIVTDTKSHSRKEAKKQFSIIAEQAGKSGSGVLNRIVPQIYDQSMYETLEDIYPFPTYIYTLYASKDSDKEVVRFVQENPKIKAVTMPEQRVSLSFTAALKKAGVVTYVHTINDFAQYEKYRKAGIDGIYTDFLDKYAIEIETLKKQQPAVVHVKAALPGN